MATTASYETKTRILDSINPLKFVLQLNLEHLNNFLFQPNQTLLILAQSKFKAFMRFDYLCSACFSILLLPTDVLWWFPSMSNMKSISKSYIESSELASLQLKLGLSHLYKKKCPGVHPK